MYKRQTLRWERSSSVVADTSLQYRGTHGGIEHTVLAGFDYTRPKNQSERYDRTASNIDYYNPVYGAPLGQPTRDEWWSYNADSTQLGLYLQDQMKIADKWVVLLGGRYDHVRDNQSNLYSGEKSIDNEKKMCIRDSYRHGRRARLRRGLQPAAGGRVPPLCVHARSASNASCRCRNPRLSGLSRRTTMASVRARRGASERTARLSRWPAPLTASLGSTAQARPAATISFMASVLSLIHI